MSTSGSGSESLAHRNKRRTSHQSTEHELEVKYINSLNFMVALYNINKKLFLFLACCLLRDTVGEPDKMVTQGEYRDDLLSMLFEVLKKGKCTISLQLNH